MPKTKIVCTLGPASSSAATIRKMFMAGMDVARLNFSHGSHVQHQKMLDTVRYINKKYRRHVRILQDLEGYRIRIGHFKKGHTIELKKRHTVWFTEEDVLGTDRLIPLGCEGVISDIRSGQLIYIDDGNVIIKARRKEGKRLRAEVVSGGILKERKGVNVPGLKLHFCGITPKDKKDAMFAIKNKVDYVAQSFVRTARDVAVLKKTIGNKIQGCKIIAKIENREGIKNIDSILDTADGIMVARGDMGVSIPVYEVPIVQKEIIKKCNRAGKPVITATQMLESMTTHGRPTRAEAADVSNAILDGSDFLMLSAETASGAYPAEAVKTMDQIIVFTERSAIYRR